jgi:phage baseplate assembly protein W
MTTRINRTFSDLDAAFTRSPRTRDVANKIDDNAIRGALRNLIHTKHYERPFQPELGCQIHNLLFEQNDPMTVAIAQRVIRDAIVKFEPRVTLVSVDVNITDSNEMFIQIVYKIRNTETPSTFTTTFTRVR